MDNRPLSKWFTNGYPNGLSMANQIVYQPQSKWIIQPLVDFQANHQHLFKWIIQANHQVDYDQVDNRPLSKWFMNGYPNSLSATIHVNY